MSDDENKNGDDLAEEGSRKKNSGWLAIGLALGVGLGTAFGNVTIGIAIGIAVGAALMSSGKPFPGGKD